MILNHPSILQKFSLPHTSPTSNSKVLEHSNPGTKRLDSKSKIIFGIPLFPSHLNPNTHTPQGRKNLCLLSLHVPQDSSVFTLKATVYKKKKNRTLQCSPKLAMDQLSTQFGYPESLSSHNSYFKVIWTLYSCNLYHIVATSSSIL